MKFYALTSLADGTVASFVPTGSARIRNDVAVWIAYLAEFDRRRLFVPEGYSSLFDYCLRKLKLSEDEASKYIRVARTARKFPVVFEALADRRLHLSGAVLLARHLRPENVDELLAAAAHRTRAAIEQLIAERFPSSDVPSLVRVIEPFVTAPAIAPIEMKSTRDLPAPGRVKLSTTELPTSQSGDPAGLLPAPVVEPSREPAAPARVIARATYARVAPLAPQRYALQCTLDQEAHDDLLRAQELLGHSIPHGDIAKLVGRALKLLVRDAEKRKFSAVERPRETGRATSPKSGGRQIPAHVRRAVSKRDGGRCTFVSSAGHRCEGRIRLEFDHIEPVARGGRSTVANLRLRCRAHNQFEAERSFGADFMRQRREAARQQRTEGRQQSAPGNEQQRASAEHAPQQAATEHARLEVAELARAATQQVRAAAEAQCLADQARTCHR